MDLCTTEFTVGLPDVGENNKLTNKGFLKMLQEAACIHSKFLGISVQTSQLDGYAWVILNWKLEVFSRPTWNAKLRVNTWCRKVSHLFFYRDFEVFDDNNNLVAVACSKWILFNLNTNSIVKNVDEVKARYSCIDKSACTEKMDEKLIVPDNEEFIREYTVLRRDIDTNHHVNNLNYLDFAFEIVPVNDFNNVEIMYKHEAKYGETLNLFCAKNDDSTFVTIKNDDNSKIHCVIKLY